MTKDLYIAIALAAAIAFLLLVVSPYIDSVAVPPVIR